jgi:hypothetical protein
VRHPSAARRLRLAAVAAGALFAACAAGPPPARTGAAPAAPTAVSAPAAAAAASNPFDFALAAALAAGDWRDLRIETECSTGEGYHNVRLWGSGVGVWDGARQFTLPRERVAAVLQAFRHARFGALRDSYGEGAEGDAGVQLECRVAAALGGARKQVLQLAGEPRSPELAHLADEVVALCAAPGRDGVGAASLAEGLAKVARGELAAETLVVRVNRRESEAPEAPGWLLQLDGLAAAARAYVPGGGLGPERTLLLPPAEAAALAGRLAEAGIDQLPGNLWADGYTDLEVAVLNRRVALQARRFDRADPAAHEEARERFTGALADLAGLAQRVEAEGRLNSPAP